MVFFLSVLFPNLLLILKRLPQKSWLYGLLILAVILGFALWRLFAPGVSYSDGMGAVIRGLVFFTAGMLLALYIRTDGHSLPRSGRWVPLAFLGMVVLWTYLFQFPLTLFHLLYAPLLLTLYRGIPALIPPDLSQWLGARSFALCMSHYPCLLAIRYFLGDFLHQAADTAIWGKAGCYFLVIALVLLMAEITYRLFDRPRISTVPPTIR